MIDGTAEAVVDLQIRMMEQEQSIEALSEQVLIHAERVDKLQRYIEVLEQKLARIETADLPTPEAVQSEAEKPPHY